MSVFFDITESINFFLNYACTGIALAAIFFGVLIYSKKSIKNQGLSQGVLLSVALTIEIAIAILIFWALPIPFVKMFPYSETASIIRLGAISLVTILHFRNREHSEKRGLKSAVLHLLILNIGWFTNRWIGVFLFSIPLLAIFYYILYRISLVIIPVSNPEDTYEKNQRYLVFLSYVWGLQMPLWNVSKVDAKEAEKRIDGKPVLNPFSSQHSSSQNRGNANKRGNNISSKEALFPGMIRTNAHQVVGIINGKDFRVEGPGIIFTKKEDEPFEVVDLRTQTRKSFSIHAFSKEGLPFLADVVIVFTIDRDDWNLGLYHQLGRVNTLLNKGKDVDRNAGLTFPYSQARVEAAIRLRSKRSQPNGGNERWDDHVVAMAEQAARQTFAERSIKDLWQARENENGNSSEMITSNIKRLIENPLRENGIRLINVKASGFKFTDKKEQNEKDDEVIEQQIATWKVERERERDMALADAKAEAERIEEEARVYARSVLLTAIMEGLEQAREHHPGKDQEAIAQVYLEALKNMIEQQSNLSYTSEARADLQKFKDHYFANSPKK